MVQNVYETQCCQEIERCIQSLHSDEVLEDVENTTVLYYKSSRIQAELLGEMDPKIGSLKL